MGKNKEKPRPGVVVYFDMLKTLEKLSPEARAAILMAALYRGQDLSYQADFSGIKDIENRIRAETLWESYCPRVDSDGDGWRDGILQRKYAGYVSSCRRKDEEPMSFEEYGEWYERVQSLT